VNSGQIQPFVRGVRGPDFIAFQPQHPRKQVGDALIVVDD